MTGNAGQQASFPYSGMKGKDLGGSVRVKRITVVI